VRNVEKGIKAKEEIARRNGGNDSTIIDVWKLDMDSFDSVKAFAERADKELDHLDVALLNAGLVMRSFQQSPEGWEETIQVNVLSTALLGLLLLPKLRASKSRDATPHLAIVSSGLHVAVKRENLGHDGSLLETATPWRPSTANASTVSRSYLTSISPRSWRPLQARLTGRSRSL
jgi:NAD(P)-dependent dehydrogenase (short-subunit alcohol dehydrogenase family)